MVLSSYYKMLENVADGLPNWRNVSKNDLLNSYIDHEQNPLLKEMYMAAIMCRYWGAISKYYMSSRNSISLEDCFEWLSHAIIYALEHRKWKDPNNKLYNDPSGPDKVVNRCIISTRQIFYQASNSDSRKVNFGLESIENLEEQNLSYALPVDHNDEAADLSLKALIRKYFKSSYPAYSFIIDGIVNGDVFDTTKGNDFNKRKLAKHLRYINDQYCGIFAKNYELAYDKVKEESQIFNHISSLRLYKLIDQALCLIKKNLEKERDM